MSTINLGNGLLYASFVIGACILVALSYEQLRPNDGLFKPVRWLVRLFALLLAADFAFLSYSFLFPDFTLNYVWSYTSSDYPIYYKLSGTLAGQEGTLLFWSLLIALSALWLNEARDSGTEIVKKIQIIVMALGLYFVGLTILSTPFKTIYEINPEIPRTFIPVDGNGLNPLLLDPWMALHPFTIFAGYAGATIPFAAAMVYFYKSLRGDSPKLHRLWTAKVFQPCRIGWLFMTIGIAFGGIWAYKVMGWGGIWAWDPIEVASLIPWLVMTASMHLVVEHRRSREQYSILAPFLVAITFTFVVYATLVTRSGVFESVHAFMAGGAGPYLIALTAITFLLPLTFGIVKYLKKSVEEAPEGHGDASFLTRANIMYAATLLFIILAFISTFGITYPPIVKLVTGYKYGVGKSFFNLWSYPFFILLLLLVGLGIHYKQAERREALRTFLAIAVLTLLAAFLRPNEAWNIVDYSAIISPEKPLLYRLIGSVSALTVVPPSLYVLLGLISRGRERLTKGRVRQRFREAGVLAIHAGVVLIAIGAVFGNLFDTEITGTLNIGDSKVVKATPARVHEFVGAWGAHEWGPEGTSPYGVQLVDYREYSDYGSGYREAPPGDTVAEVYSHLNSPRIEEEHTVYGLVEEEVDLGDHTLVRIGGGEGLWAVGVNMKVPKGAVISATGTLMADFNIQSLNRTFPILLLAEHMGPYQSPYKKVDEVRVAVYKYGEKFGEATARNEIYRNGDAKRVGIDRSLWRDVYVIYSGQSGREMPITIKIIPLINWVWIGVLLFVLGISLTYASDLDLRSKVAGW